MSGERGSSLIEVVVACGVFAVSLLGLGGLLVSSIRTSEFARDVATARFLATQRLEQVKAVRYQDGDRDAYNDTGDPCTDIDEVTASNFPDEDYGAIDLRNGQTYTYRTCSSTPDIRLAATLFTRSSYPTTTQGNHDYYVNHTQYARFRREVYIYDTASEATLAVTNVSLDDPRPSARDTLVVTKVTPSVTNPKTNYVKYVFVRVKWKDGHGALHAVTLSTQKAFAVPAS